MVVLTKGILVLKDKFVVVVLNKDRFVVVMEDTFVAVLIKGGSILLKVKFGVGYGVVVLSISTIPVSLCFQSYGDDDLSEI